MFRFLKKILKIAFFAAIIAGIFSLGQYYGETQCETCPPQDLDFSLFWEASGNNLWSHLGNDRIS